jgi:hypothetical protein
MDFESILVKIIGHLDIVHSLKQKKQFWAIKVISKNWVEPSFTNDKVIYL